MEAVMFKAFLKDESGSTAVEYGLIALFVMLGIVVNASLIGDSLSRIFAETQTSLLQ
ncbi:Flp family type IVb pilin [Chelatococcus composti]|jgi:pilus assembly protein Flp/PilA|nr:Flp family type IVb pilin [Chelatococcus composti]PZN46007.1 MAG: Flp family type IVb pilin [Pseudomonadota bacterium]